MDALLRSLVEYAALAPSGHNTQPWRFRLRGGGAELLADRTRALPVVDPDDRELVISCGAALGVMSQGELHSLALSIFLPGVTLAESSFPFHLHR